VDQEEQILTVPQMILALKIKQMIEEITHQGHFVLASRLHTNSYLDKKALYASGDREFIFKAIAEQFQEDEIDLVISPESKASKLVLSAEIAFCLSGNERTVSSMIANS